MFWKTPHHVRVYALYIKFFIHNDAHICISLLKIFFDKKHVCVEGGVMLPNMFVRDFGDQFIRYATLVNPNNNEFQVLVEKFNGSFFKQKDDKLFLISMVFV